MSTQHAFISHFYIILHLIIYRFCYLPATHPPTPETQPCLSHAPLPTRQTLFFDVTSGIRCKPFVTTQEYDRAIDFLTRRNFGSLQYERFERASQQFGTPWTATLTNDVMSMITTRAGKANKGLAQIEELRLKNKEINDKKRDEEAAKQREKEKEEEASTKAATITPRNLLGSMNDGETRVTPEVITEENIDLELEDVGTLMDIDNRPKENDEGQETFGLSPVKKRSKGKRSTSSRPRSTSNNPTSTNSAVNNSTAKSATFLDEVIYPHARIIIELAIMLKSDKAFEEFTQALMAFVTNAQMVDPKFVINPIQKSSKEKNISSKADISPNMTKLGTHVKISGNGNAFNKKKVWNNSNNDRKSRKNQKEEFRDPVVYFSMVISTEVDPKELIERVTHEWSRLNGTRLQVKDLQSISSETVVTFFKISTSTPKNVILAELTKILLEAQTRSRNDVSSDDYFDLAKYDFALDEGIEVGESLPPMNLRVQNALLRGQEVTVFNKLSHHAQQARKSWHLEVDSRHAAKMKVLIERAKTYGCVEELWGPHAHLSEVTDATSTAREAKRQVDVAQSHTNYQLSMVAEELVGVVNLDAPVIITHPESGKEIGQLSLRTALLNYLKMKDGHPMIAEVHQEDICKPTYIVVPQTEEAERMIGMMTKNIPAFL